MTPFNETIREIAERACLPCDGDVRCALVGDVETAIYRAFDEFAKREPSEAMQAEGLSVSDGYTSMACCVRIFRAMIAKAVKEMKE